MAKVKVYRKDTGEMSWVPEHWMEHPLLSKPFRKTPTQKRSEAQAEAEKQAQTELAALEAILYGDEVNEPRLPLPAEVITLLTPDAP